MELVYIAFCAGKKEIPVHMLEIVNHAEILANGKLKYTTKDGEQIKSREEITNRNIYLVNKSDIDIKDSLFWWYKQNPNNYNKQLIEDNELKIGQDYYGNSWRYGLRLLVFENSIKYKIILK